MCRLGEEKGIERLYMCLEDCLVKGIKISNGLSLEMDLNEIILNKRLKKLDYPIILNWLEKKSNPYYYVKNSDVFLLSSFHEAAPMVFGEAHAMGVPILTTNTASAYELVENRGLGKVCENSDEGLYNKIKEILSGDVVLERITDSKISEINTYAEHQLASFLQIVKERTNDD